MNCIIKRRFSRSSANYDSNAIAQKEIAKKLFSFIKGNLLPCEYERKLSMLEIGCGTGNLTAKLNNIPHSLFIINDLCEIYKDRIFEKISPVEFAKAGNYFIFDNAEEVIKKLDNRFDLIASASMLQWINRPLTFLKDCRPLLKEGGMLAVSTFAPGNLKEVGHITGEGLKYLPASRYYGELKDEYDILLIKEEDIELRFASPLEILKHLKHTGVNAVSHQTWTRSKLDSFCMEYKNHFKGKDGLYPLTFKPLYIILRAK